MTSYADATEEEEEEEDNELQSLSLDELEQLPGQLQEQQSEINSKIRALALQHYPVHIHSFEALEQVTQTAKKGRDTCQNAIEKAKQATRLCRGDILNRLHSRVKLFKSVKATTEQYSRLSDLLKMPQFFELCVRNGMHDDAMELLNSFSSIIHRHSHSIVFPATPRDDSKSPKHKGEESASSPHSGATEPQQQQLLGLRTRCLPALLGLLYSSMLDSADALERMTMKQFETDLTIPQILDSARLLKRLSQTKRVMRRCLYDPNSKENMHSKEDGTNEIQEITDAFLQARSRWVTAKVNLNLPSSPFEQLSQMMDVLSTKIPDVQRQLRAFLSIFGQEQSLGEQRSISEWAERVMAEFVATMDNNIKLITDPDELLTLIEQSGYAADKTAQCGFHPTISLLEGLVLHARDLFRKELDAAVDRFGQHLTNWFQQQGTQESPEDTAQQKNHMKAIKEVPPMALLWDDIVESWEQYKKCFPSPLLYLVSNAIENTANEALFRLYNVANSFHATSRKIDLSFDVFETHFIPLLKSSFETNALADAIVRNASWI
eukprot:gb/GECG01013737.1/.p1 GENE.gb/GECG01013737.1/~~gb/GECG01013737.1/.p1  ORF type:complete len:549 (+),score=71.31 gb/GECG01013737.1/:1-1647(+)